MYMFFNSIIWSQERVCEDSASFDLTSHDLAQCISDIGHILDLKQKGETYLEEGGTYIDIFSVLLLCLEA